MRMTVVGAALVLVGSLAMGGCGAIGGGSCAGNSKAAVTFGGASADANAILLDYNPTGAAETVHTSDEVSGAYTLCNLGLSDTNRTLTFEIYLPGTTLTAGMSYMLQPSGVAGTGAGCDKDTCLSYGQGGLDPSNQPVWDAKKGAGSLTLTALTSNSATVTFTNVPLSPALNNTAAKGTFSISGSATIAF